MKGTHYRCLLIEATHKVNRVLNDDEFRAIHKKVTKG
jgi:hypothetical protein